MQPDLFPPQPTVASSQNKHFNSLIIPVVLLSLMLVGALGFGFWSYSQAREYKNNIDEKVNERLADAVSRAEAAKEYEFVQREKEPLTEYVGPAAMGSLVVKYPKTWSAYIDETRDGIPIDGYFHPNFVPGVGSGTAFALRVEVLTDDYATVLRQFDSAANRGEVNVTAIKPVNVPSVTGARVDGQIKRDRRGSVVLFPIRDKTLRLTTEAEQFVKDFNEIILANLTFKP